MRKSLKPNSIYLGDCLEIMPLFPDKCLNMIIADLPYNKTAQKWDAIIPFKELWVQYNRLIKPNGAIVLFGAEPFSSQLRLSNIESYRYDLVWDKCNTSNWTNAKRMPLRRHENILVFYKEQPTYNPQFEFIDVNDYRFRENGRGHKEKEYNNTVYGNIKEVRREETGKRYPNSILKFSNSNRNGKLHPTQKPVKLYEYLIKTFSNEGDLVMDNVAGSGTLGEACIKTDRNYIMIEKDPKFIELIKNRINSLKK